MFSLFLLRKSRYAESSSFQVQTPLLLHFYNMHRVMPSTRKVAYGVIGVQ
ncbi:hypothetical protein HMPREF1588_03139 [Escherichia coli 110957]|nr:hypothetical protein HMPREF1588_03139 [Escherichia coli 110957]